MQKKSILFITSSLNLEIILKDILSDKYNMIKIIPKDLHLPNLKLFTPLIIIIDDKEFQDSILKTVQSIRQQKEFRAIPILTISKNLKQTYIQALKKHGATECLFEPIFPEDLLNKINIAKKFEVTQTKLHSITPHDQSLTPEHIKLSDKFFLNKTTMNPIINAFSKDLPFAIALLQIDNLEMIHTKLSSSTSKSIMTKTTSIINKELKFHSKIFPLGNGKYFSIFIGLSKTTILTLCKNLQKTLKNTPLINNKIKTTLSIGLALKEGNDFKNIEEMVHSAKQSLATSLQITNHISIA